MHFAQIYKPALTFKTFYDTKISEATKISGGCPMKRIEYESRWEIFKSLFLKQDKVFYQLFFITFPAAFLSMLFLFILRPAENHFEP